MIETVNGPLPRLAHLIYLLERTGLFVFLDKSIFLDHDMFSQIIYLSVVVHVTNGH